MSVEDLLKELETAKDDFTPESPELIDATAYKNDIIAFLSVFKILPGDNRVRKSVMHSLYKSWSDSPVDSHNFNLQFASLIPSEIKSSKHFYINQSAIKITYDAFKLRNSKLDKIKSKKWAVRFQLFLDHYNLKEGDLWIHEALLIELHERYMFMKRGRIEMNSLYTISFLKVFFKHKSTKHGNLYLVNSKVMDNFTKKEVRKLLDRYEKKAIKKKQAQASRTGPEIRAKNKS